MVRCTETSKHRAQFGEMLPYSEWRKGEETERKKKLWNKRGERNTENVVFQRSKMSFKEKWRKIVPNAIKG